MESGVGASSTRLLMDLQQVSQIAHRLSGCLDPTTIAQRVTDHLVQIFDCAFARIWLVEPDQTALRLVASSGLYTHTDGSFARVPMGAFKVGKIAQNRIPFLSNHLADEPWVKDRDWAIAQGITGFAGYPLAVGDRVVGVLAVFSHQPFSSEFIEVLQWLCTTITLALEAAFTYQRETQSRQNSFLPSTSIPLSEQIVALLPQVCLVLIGTERALPVSLHYLLLRTAEILSSLPCSQCRLMYEAAQVSFDAMIALSPAQSQAWMTDTLEDLCLAAKCLNGNLQTSTEARQTRIQLVLPYSPRTRVTPLSEREQAVLRLLSEGLRDRDIASALHISERTVKFHLNNAMVKLKAQTRYQALYQAAVQGWLTPFSS